MTSEYVETAQLDSQDTAAPEFEAPPTETDATTTEPTETASTEGATEDPLASLEDAALRANPRIKAILDAQARDTAAGVEGRHRQELAAAQASALAERHTADRQYQASDKFVSDFETIIRNADLDAEGRPVLDRAALKQLNGLNIRTGADIPVSALANLMAQTVGEGFQQTVAEREAQTAAYSHFHQTLDPQPLFRHWLTVAGRAITERSRDALRAEVNAERDRDDAAKAEAAKAELAAKGRNGAGPTGVRGTPVRTGGPTNDFEATTQRLSTGTVADGVKVLRELGISI